jgi:hypothetical protein
MTGALDQRLVKHRPSTIPSSFVNTGIPTRGNGGLGDGGWRMEDGGWRLEVVAWEGTCGRPAVSRRTYLPVLNAFWR